MSAVELQKVSKRSNEVELHEVTFRADDAGITCLVGPSGAGKRLVSRLVAGLVRPDGGRVRVLGQDPFLSQALHRRCISVFGDIPLPPGLYLDDMLLHASRLYGFSEEDARKSLHSMGLWEARHTRIRRLAPYKSEMAKFLIPIASSPDVVLVDGMEGRLDDADREFVYGRLYQTSRVSGTAVLITTNRRRSIDSYADRIVTIRDGAVEGVTDVAKERAGAGTTLCRIRVSDVVGASRLLRVLRVEGNAILIREPSEGLSSAIYVLEQHGIRATAFERLGEGSENGSEPSIRIS